jgi:hypothetical protein
MRVLKKLWKGADLALLAGAGVLTIAGWVTLFTSLGKQLVEWEEEWKHRRASR